jgi:nucleoside-diphosphate-sugar epimerase
VKVLVTGSEGYLGSLTAPYLARSGHDVTGLDAGFFRSSWLGHGPEMIVATRIVDVRRLEPADLAGFDAVVHMGELSNDPLGELDAGLTHAVNHRGSVRLAEMARAAGVERFVHMSSCSVYGVASEGDVDERSPVNPQTAYAECKVLVERDVAALADERFSPVFMRNATAFGASPRLRFDIVVNNLSGHAFTQRRIAMTSDGTPWRPLVHALDIAKSIVCVLAAPREAIHGETFNVGDSGLNLQVREIAEIVARVFPGCELSFGDQGADNRSYRVSFTKINTRLPGFSCEWDVERGARQLRTLFERIGLTEELFLSRHHTRLKQLQYLIETHQVDTSLFWTPET